MSQKEAGTPEITPAADTGAEASPVEEKKKREYKDFGHEEEKATREWTATPVSFEISFANSRSNIQMPKLIWLRHALRYYGIVRVLTIP